MLPPSTITVDGPLQPWPVRQTRIPLPYLAPTINPAFFTPGMIPTHWAFPRISSGIPLSGALMISCITVVASEKRSIASVRGSAVNSIIGASASVRTTAFIPQSPFSVMISGDIPFLEYTSRRVIFDGDEQVPKCRLADIMRTLILPERVVLSLDSWSMMIALTVPEKPDTLTLLNAGTP